MTIRRWVVSAAAIAALSTAPALAQPPDAPDPRSSPAAPDTAGPMATLLDTSATTAAREAAADRLVELANRPEIARTLVLMIQGRAQPLDAGPIVLSAIGRAWNVPGRLARPLLEAADAASPEATPAFMPAIAALRNPEAARALVRFLGVDRPLPVRTAAAAALVKMTGRDDLGNEVGLWRDWLEHAKGLAMPAWESLLAEGVWRRAQRLESDRKAIADRLADGYRQLYLALPPIPAPERARLLSQLLLGARPELRDLGFEIAAREVAGGNHIDLQVADSAGQLLASTEAEVRGRAAALLMQTSGPDAASRLAAALNGETDPTAAAQMLAGLARWPDPAAREPALRWLESGLERCPAAADALLTLARNGLLEAPADRQRIVRAIRPVKPPDLTPAACHLLVLFGDESDRAAVAGLLEGSSAPLRLATAEALADRREYAARILAAAQSDPALFEAAVRAVSRSQPTPEGYESIAALPAPSPDARRLGLLRVAGAASLADLVRMASATQDLPLRIDLLSRLTTQTASLPSEGEMDPPALAAGVLLLGRTYLDAKQPELAVAALDAMPEPPAGLDAAAITALRVTALVWGNRLDEARSLDAPPSAWLEGLERAIAEPHARAILKTIRQRFPTGLDAADTQRLQRLAGRLSSASSSSDANAAADDHEPGK